MKLLYLFIYYLLIQFLPMQPIPGYKLFYKIRYFFIKKVLKKCGDKVVVKNRAYFGNGSRLEVGSRSQIGRNIRLEGTITIGEDVLMGGGYHNDGYISWI